MTNSPRLQFRVNQQLYEPLDAIARRRNTSPSAVAKSLLENALMFKGSDPKNVAEDLLIVRAGIERLFQRSNSEEELARAVRLLRQQRNVFQTIEQSEHES